MSSLFVSVNPSMCVLVYVIEVLITLERLQYSRQFSLEMSHLYLLAISVGSWTIGCRQFGDNTDRGLKRSCVNAIICT